MKKKIKILITALVFSIFLSQIAYAETTDILDFTGTLEGKIIILDAGHGAGDNTYKDYSEGDTVYIIAKKLVPLLE